MNVYSELRPKVKGQSCSAWLKLKNSGLGWKEGLGRTNISNFKIKCLTL